MHAVAPRNIAILGATGSIGASALDVIARHPERFTVVALTAHRQWEALLELVRRFRPAHAALLDPSAARELAAAVRREGLPTRVVHGSDGLCALRQRRKRQMANPRLMSSKTGTRAIIAMPSTRHMRRRLATPEMASARATASQNERRAGPREWRQNSSRPARNMATCNTIW